MKNKAVVLLSSGLDSTVNLYEMYNQGEVTLCLTFDYGQRAAIKEIECAQKICEILDVPLKIIELKWFSDFTRTSLIDKNQSVPTGRHIKIDDQKVSEETAKSVWVPNRNGIFLNIAAGFAEGLDASYVVTGFNAEEGATFPDNTQGFLDALDRSFQFSTASHVLTKSFTTELNKTEIVKRGIELKVPFSLMWPCYFSAEHWCGECESCQRFFRALRAVGMNPEDL